MNIKGGFKLMKPMGVTEEPAMRGSFARAQTLAPANSGSSDVHKFAAILHGLPHRQDSSFQVPSPYLRCADASL